MAVQVNQHIEGHYELRLTRPQELWLEILKGKMMAEGPDVIRFAVEQGLMELIRKLGPPFTM